MSLWRLLLREARFRVGTTLLSGVVVTLAVGVWAACLVLLRGHDARTVQALERRGGQVAEQSAAIEEEMRKATLKLRFNLAILPAGQDLRAWYTEGEIRGTLPESYVRTLAESGIMTIQHLLPIVQRRVFWEERGRRIILIGSRGEVAQANYSAKKPLVQPVPPGTIVLGHELHRSLGLKVGDLVTLLGREFTVHRCHEERGSVDDITAWIDLGQAQELFAMPDRLHAILALECMCAGLPGADKFRAEVRRILPQTDVIELSAPALARFEARGKLTAEVEAAAQREAAARQALTQSRERLAAGLLPAVLLAGMLAVAALAAANARTRGPELALLRALGWREGQVLLLLLARAALAALPGAVVGCGLGVLVGVGLAGGLDPLPLAGPPPLLSLAEAAGMIAAGPLAALLAAWLPALLAARRDPAPALCPE
jgi:ABC-type lipoprotein release transport system permease subunit